MALPPSPPSSRRRPEPSGPGNRRMAAYSPCTCSISTTSNAGSRTSSNASRLRSGGYSNEPIVRLRRRLRCAVLHVGDVVGPGPAVSRSTRPGPGARLRRGLHQRHARLAHARHPVAVHRIFRHGAAHRLVRLRGVHGAGQVPAARRGDRAMNEVALSPWVAVPAAVLLISGGLLTLTG